MSTAEEIRDEAVERLAKAMWWMRPTRDVPCPWEDATEIKQWPYMHRAGVLVDALGDMLPTAVESRYKGRGLDRQTRYVTDWQEAAE